jgi:hypothetical protein
MLTSLVGGPNTMRYGVNGPSLARLAGEPSRLGDEENE